MKRFFVTGINTDIGKTFVSSILFNHLGDTTCYYKPIQTGCESIKGNLYIPDLQFIKNNSINKNNKGFICSYPLKYPLSPHMSAKKTNTTIDVKNIKTTYKVLENNFKNIVVEGAGGIFTPINHKNHFIIDLIKELNLKTLIVTSSEIGTINQTIMTINHLTHYGIKISGLIFNNFKNKCYENENIDFIKSYSKIHNILSLPHIKRIEDVNKEKILNFIKHI